MTLVDRDYRELHNEISVKHFDLISMNKFIENKAKFIEQYK